MKEYISGNFDKKQTKKKTKKKQKRKKICNLENNSLETLPDSKQPTHRPFSRSQYYYQPPSYIIHL